jgi:transcriptional regulator with XRE-family HTH domain
LKISNKTLSNWENGISVPNINQVNALCELYGRRIDELNFLPNNPF